jgi:hypothetical protein
MREGGRVGDVVDRDDLDVALLPGHDPQNVAADASEPVDATRTLIRLPSGARRNDANLDPPAARPATIPCVDAVRAATALALAAWPAAQASLRQPPAAQILSGTVDRVVDGGLVARVDGGSASPARRTPQTATGRGSAGCYRVEAADAARLLSPGRASR